ncbi:MAG: alpha/beta fold hydrolase [Pseudomonadales bacterium]
MGRTALTVHPDGLSIALSAELSRPDDAFALLVLAHGAGAGFRHASMVAISEALARRGVATLRFNFPFSEEGRRRVDAQPVSIACLLAALETARVEQPDLPRFLGGHSYGGRMASHAAAAHDLAIEGLVFCSFPLHPSKKPGTTRALHLADVPQPMLFLSGTRDDLADRSLLEGVVAGLGGRARLHWLDTANHGYRVLKRSRQVGEDVFDEMAGVAADFMRALC